MNKLISKIKQQVDFSFIRYSQCWEDADVLLSGLQVQETDVCLSISSAGDNTLAIASQSPQKIYAVDFNPAQNFCLELKMAAFRELSYMQMLGFLGAKKCDERMELYHRCRQHLSEPAQTFWDANPIFLQRGIDNVGKLEKFFFEFREMITAVHSRETIEELFAEKSAEEQRRFFDEEWNTESWQEGFRSCFCEASLNKARDAKLKQYADLPVEETMEQQSHRIFREIPIHDNAYMQWIALGTDRNVFPYYMRPENFESIRNNLDCIEIYNGSIESFFDQNDEMINCFNLSDIFEYVSNDHFEQCLELCRSKSAKAARMLYWNVFTQRFLPENLMKKWRSLDELAEKLHQQDKLYFYSHLQINEAI